MKRSHSFKHRIKNCESLELFDSKVKSFKVERELLHFKVQDGRINSWVESSTSSTGAKQSGVSLKSEVLEPLALEETLVCSRE